MKPTQLMTAYEDIGRFLPLKLIFFSLEFMMISLKPIHLPFLFNRDFQVNNSLKIWGGGGSKKC